MAGEVTSDDTLSRMCRQFEESENTTRPARERAERDRDYRDLKQWTSKEEAALKARGQPVVTFDRISRKVNSLLGMEKQTRKDPKAFPRNPDDDKAAEAATDAIRYVCEDSRWDDKRSLAMENLVVEGTGAIMVGVKKTKAGIDPDIRRIPWDRLYHDPHSAEFDFEDAAYMGIVVWMDLDDAKLKYPDAAEALETTWAAARNSETYDDRPKHNLWADYARKRVRICEHYYREGGKWMFCMFTKGGFVVEPQPSPYQGDDGEPENPIKAVSLYIDRDNNRYGDVRAMIGPQDEINKRRSKALHLISQRQVRVSPAMGKSAEEIRAEVAKPDGVFVGEDGDVEILETNDMAQANLTMLQEAKNEIDLLGPNAALAGKGTQEQSGRAILAQQQGGMLEAATILDRVRVLSLAVYRSVWCRIRQHWTAERWIRVTDNEQNLRFVGLNRPVTMLEAAAQQMGVTQENFAQMQQERPQEMQQLAMLAQSPQAQQVVKVDNAVAELDVDILVDEGIDTPTIAAEQFDQMIKLVSSGAVQISPDVLIEASSLRNKDKLLEMQKQGPSPEQQQMQKLELAGAEAKVADTQASAMLKQAQAQKAGQPEAQQAPEQTDPLEAAIRAEELALEREELELKRAEIANRRAEVAIKRGELGVHAYSAETARMAAMKPEPAQKEAA
jgi:hypothetical protein